MVGRVSGEVVARGGALKVEGDTLFPPLLTHTNTRVVDRQRSARDEL